MDGIATPLPADAGYDTDFYAWSMDQARRIRALSVPGLDVENVAEEIESLGRSDKRELVSRSRVLLGHLLKWTYQPTRRGESWSRTIFEQRGAIEVVLNESPSLRPTYPDILDAAYRYARGWAANETGLPEKIFPAECPWTVAECLDPGWTPGGPID